MNHTRERKLRIGIFPIYTMSGPINAWVAAGGYKNDGKAYADFLDGTLHVWGGGQSERYWIELPSQSQWSNLCRIED